MWMDALTWESTATRSHVPNVVETHCVVNPRRASAASLSSF